MRKYTPKTNKNRFFYPEEYLKFEENLKEKQKFSVKFLINTGARINEAQNVRNDDIDFENRRIILRITKTKAKKKEKKPQPRIIPISTQFARYLKAQLKDNRQLGKDICILSNPALNIAYKKAGQLAGIKDYGNISSHTFRKTLEVWLMSLGIGDLTLTAHLGHDIRTAARYYISPDVFTAKERQLMRLIIGDLYEK